MSVVQVKSQNSGRGNSRAVSREFLGWYSSYGPSDELPISSMENCIDKYSRVLIGTYSAFVRKLSIIGAAWGGGGINSMSILWVSS